jgi:hypothetical protein
LIIYKELSIGQADVTSDASGMEGSGSGDDKVVELRASDI